MEAQVALSGRRQSPPFPHRLQVRGRRRSCHGAADGSGERIRVQEHTADVSMLLPDADCIGVGSGTRLRRGLQLLWSEEQLRLLGLALIGDMWRSLGNDGVARFKGLSELLPGGAAAQPTRPHPAAMPQLVSRSFQCPLGRHGAARGGDGQT